MYKCDMFNFFDHAIKPKYFRFDEFARQKRFLSNYKFIHLVVALG